MGLRDHQWPSQRMAAVVVAALLAGCSPAATKGTMPPVDANGEVDPSTAPDFIAVAGQDAGIAGYARKDDVLRVSDGAFPVYGDDLRTLVGHLVPGKGFVPVGVDWATVPTIAVEVAPSSSPHATHLKEVVLYVRNDSESQAWITVLIGGQRRDDSGFPGQNMGVGCYAMPVGSRLVLLDRSPDQVGFGVLRELYVRGLESEPPSLSVTIGADGSIQQGTGVPVWWGAPQTC
jgi:hypothetical protein